MSGAMRSALAVVSGMLVLGALAARVGDTRALGSALGPVRAQAEARGQIAIDASQAPTLTVSVHLPRVLHTFGGAFPRPEPATATPRGPATAATNTPTVSRTPLPRPTRTPTATPESIDYPRGSGTIILQMGWTYGDTIGNVWQEMEGTPWLTLYGDGRLIAGPKLLDRMQLLYETRLSERDVARWMDQLAYRVTFFSMNSTYAHPAQMNLTLHVYGRITAGSWRVSLRSWEEWARGPAPDIPGAGDAMRLVNYVKERESELATILSEPYQAEKATILAQESQPPFVPDPPQWPLANIDVAAIADQAPRGRVGHRFVGADLAAQAMAAVVPVADQYFPFEYRVAEFLVGSRTIAVGVRQEVLGGSEFLPPSVREAWYRRDRDSGDPLLLELGGIARPQAVVRSAMPRRSGAASAPRAPAAVRN